MTEMPILALVCFVLFSCAGFFFALAETSLFTLGKRQVAHLTEVCGARGGRVAKLLERPRDLLATIVLGNTVANAGLVSLGVWMILHHGWSELITLPGVLLLILVVGEVVPKSLAVRGQEFWAVRVAVPMQFFMAVTRPIRRAAVWVTDWLVRTLPAAAVTAPQETSEAEYTELIELGAQQGALAESEEEIILQIISLDRRMARDVMKPRAQMNALPDDLPKEEMIATARRFKHRRLPLYDGSPDTIVGVLNTRKLLLEPEADLAESIEFPSFVPETINLLQLLRRLQQQQRGLAIVLDEYGSTAGLVTIEDILGSMIGRIRGEGEPEGFVFERIGKNRWRVNGTMRMDDFRREYAYLGDIAGVETMGGLLLALAGVVPPAGYSVQFGSLKLTATIVDDRRVRELLVEVVPKGGDKAR